MIKEPASRRLYDAGGFGAAQSHHRRGRSLGKPAAAYPGRVATDVDMTIAVDLEQTKLTVPMAATDTQMTVADPSVIAPYSLLSIDSEIVEVTGPASGNVIPVSRGFDGTHAALHLASAIVSGFVVAYHHNRLVAEIEAIEATLGANLQNIPAASVVSAPAYAFPAQSPGGSLTVGTNAITLSPVPKGVNGSDTNHYLYISGGTGTAEAVPITGGAAVAGAASGQVFITCANAHSGAWTIQSATAGAQEAHNDKVGAVLFPAGTFDWYGPFWNNGNARIDGAGQQTTILRFNSTSMKMFDIERDYFCLRHVTLHCQGTAVSGSAGIYSAANGSNVTGAVANNALIEDVRIEGFYNGMYTHGGGGSFNVYRVQVNNSVSDGIVCRQTQGYWETICVINNGGNGLTVSPAAGTSGVPPFFTGIQTFSNQGWGIYATMYLEISGLPSFLNNDKAGEIYMKVANATCAGWIKDASIQWAGNSPVYGMNTTAPGILLDTTCGPVTMDNLQIIGCQGSSVIVKSSSHIMTGCYIGGSGAGGVAGNIYAIDMTNCGAMLIIGNTIRGSSRFSPSAAGAGNLLLANNFSTTDTVATVEIMNGVDWIINNNYFYNAGAGNCFQIDSGVTYNEGFNVQGGGGLVNNGTRSVHSIHLT